MEHFTQKDIDTAYDSGLKNGKSIHNSPSPETRERLMAVEIKLESNQKIFMDKLQEFNNDNKDQHNDIKMMILKLDEKLEKALIQKANVWVEKVIIWLGIIIGGGVITYLGSVIIRIIETL